MKTNTACGSRSKPQPAKPWPKPASSPFGRPGHSRLREMSTWPAFRRSKPKSNTTSSPSRRLSQKRSARNRAGCTTASLRTTWSTPPRRCRSKRPQGLIRQGILALAAILRQRALEFKHTPTIGRTHGIHAEPTTFGLKLLNWYAEIQRDLVRFDASAEDMRVGKLSGAVGTFGHLKPEHEESICAKLGLRPDPSPPRSSSATAMPPISPPWP